MAASATAKAAVSLLAAALPVALADRSVSGSAWPVCEQPIVPGPCRGSFPRWAHDAETGECVQFTYGGCGGNSNNFETRAECERRCDVGVPVCELPIVPGPCRGSFPRWGHDEESGQCIQFIYGGCGGNGNRFETQAECEKACDVPPTDVCELPIVPGPCRASIPSWGWDGEECVWFIYGGCEGNGNRFETQGECVGACGGYVDICSLPIYPPNQDEFCLAALPRWTYINGQGCVEFIYGGCGGTANIFESERECYRACARE